MTTRMLIDARHPEETRVAVLKGNRIEEFDFESADHKQIKGNIYLAKVTRVEPSLQAAFVDFGGNRHGFLAFSEIHPDYYQIPKEDREALLAEEAAHAEEEAALRAADDDEHGDNGDDDDGDEFDPDGSVQEVDTSEKDDVATIEGGELSDGEDDGDYADAETDADADGDREPAADAAGDDDGQGEADEGRNGGRQRRGRRQGRAQSKQADELRDKRMALRRRYKIQDVIQRRQVLLVQVVKEERGNKGAALTTYLSLAGRYCVLMPNSGHGGGISRKISSAADRKRLKTIIAEMNLPKSMGCIVRTAGLQRTKTEIKRDFDYLARLWDEIRENTLKSSAPALIHSDSDLIKRAIRDIYNKEIEEVIVEGDGGYRSAKEFMKLLMPSHARRVKQYADPVPLFQRFGAEDQLSAMYDPVVQLRSGGYLVINPTEALVSIDINSGRSTKEHGIEATALKTNLEAAAEIARQLRLRDMAGLVVIDFIDMEYGSNVRKVEKAMKDALRNDRARIQVGRISGFGLMEMSRQRLRTGVLEATTRSCPHCDGSGLVRTASSAGLSALRLIEDEAAKGKGTVISLYASQEAAIYLLNAKRGDLAGIEELYGVRVEVLPEGEDEGAKMRVASSGPRPTHVPRFEPIADLVDDDEDFEDYPEEAEDEGEEEPREARAPRERDDERGGRKRRRRGGRGRDRDDERPRAEASDEDAPAEDEGEPSGEAPAPRDEDGDGEGPRKRRRRGRRRRGGRNRGDGEGAGESEGAAEGEDNADGEQFDGGMAGTEATAEVAAQLGEDIAVVAEPEAEAKPRRRSRAKKPVADSNDAPVPDAEAPVAETPVAEGAVAEAAEAEAPAAKPARKSRRKVAEPEAAEAAEAPAEAAPVAQGPAEADAAPVKKPRARKSAKAASAEHEATTSTAADEAATPAPQAANEDGDAAPRRGWWQRTFG